MTVIPHLCGFCDDTISDLGTCATCFTWEMVKCEERVTIRINRPSLSTFDRNFFVSLEQKPVSQSGANMYSSKNRHVRNTARQAVAVCL